MKPGDLVKYKERWSWTGVDRESLVGVVLELHKDSSSAAVNTLRNEQARVQWTQSLMRGELAWWVYIEDLEVISES
jgi:hypothetical protein